MKTSSCSTLALAVLGAVVVNCSHNGDQTSRPAHASHDHNRFDEPRAVEPRAEERRETRANLAIGGGPVEPGSAVAEIASARCDREARCDNIGVKAKYSSRTDCLARLQSDKRDGLNERDCPRGIDKKQLNACISAIYDESCANPLDTVSRLLACRSSSICLE